MRKHPVTEKRKVQKKGRYQIRVPAFVIQKGEFMAQKKRLSKFLPRLLAAAVAAATLIGSGGIGGISVYAAEMGAAGTEDIQPADSAENEGTETEGAGTEVWDEDTGSGSGQEVNIIPFGSHQFPASEPPGNFFLESHLRHKI